MKPLITVGITCYNEGEWLRECWESVIAQDDGRWEAVLVMDGTSHAKTIEVFDSLIHPKLRKAKMEINRGPYPTRNWAIQMTNTPYHYYLDGDDKLPVNAVRLVIEAFGRYPEAGFAFGDVEHFGSDSGVWKFQPFDIDDLIQDQCIMGPSPFRVELWRALGGYAKPLARGNADYDFWLGALEAGYTGVYIPQIIYRYRIRGANNTSVSRSYDLSYYRTHEIMVGRHPGIFADESKRAGFLYRGYMYSSRRLYSRGQLKEARALALKAKSLGFGHERAVRKILFDTSLPKPLFRMKKALGRIGRTALNKVVPSSQEEE
jgi:glycosyltransferase involved in cell wall biosynthesis